MPHDTSRTVPGARRVTVPEDAEYRSWALSLSSRPDLRSSSSVAHDPQVTANSVVIDR